MSHFTVGVIVNKLLEKEVAKVLAPYQENNMDNCPKKYLKFNPIVEEYMEKYYTKSMTRIKLKNGNLVKESDDMFKKVIQEEGKPFTTTTYEIPEELERVEDGIKYYL